MQVLPIVTGFLITLLHLGPQTSADDWSYTNEETGPSKWSQHNPSCAGGFESPINLVKSATLYDSRLKPIRMFQRTGTDLREEKFEVENNGHTLSVKIPNDLFLISLTNDTIEEFAVAKMHFHWGENDAIGSEHYLEGKQASLEMHIVCYNKMYYDNFDKASGSPSGLAVLGFMFKVTSDTAISITPMHLFTDLEKAIDEVVEPETKTEIKAFDLTEVLHQNDPGAYFRYIGSLTTPPCTANVLWNVFHSVSTVTSLQLARLRTMKFPHTEKDSKMENNFRPLQVLDTRNLFLPRVVYRSWNNASSVTVSWILITLMASLVVSVR